MGCCAYVCKWVCVFVWGVLCVLVCICGALLCACINKEGCMGLGVKVLCLNAFLGEWVCVFGGCCVSWFMRGSACVCVWGEWVCVWGVVYLCASLRVLGGGSGVWAAPYTSQCQSAVPQCLGSCLCPWEGPCFPCRL